MDFNLFICCLLLFWTPANSMDSLFGKENKNNMQSLQKTLRSATEKIGEEDKEKCPDAFTKGCFISSDFYRGIYAGLSGVSSIFAFGLTAFFPSNSPEYDEMVKSFANINAKLDKIGAKVDDILKLVPLLTQRSAYIKSVSDIRANHVKLRDFYAELNNVDCEVNKTCLQIRSNIAEKYIDYFDVHKELYMVVEGAINGFESFGESLFELIQDASDCDFDRIQNLAKSVATTIYKGAQIEMTREMLKAGGSAGNTFKLMERFKNMIDRLQKRHFEIRRECFSDIANGVFIEKKIQKLEFEGEASFNEIKPKLNDILGEIFWLTPYYFALATSNIHIYIYEKEQLVFRHINGNNGKYDVSGPQVRRIKNRHLVYINYQPKHEHKSFTYSKRHTIERIVKRALKEERLGGDWMIQRDLKAGRLHWLIKTLILTMHSVDNDDYGSFAHKFGEGSLRQSYLYLEHRNDKFVYRAYVVLYADQELDHGKCRRDCERGLCMTYPRTSQIECHCPLSFTGRKCNQHSKDGLRKTFFDVMNLALKLPSMSDTYYTIKRNHEDMKAFIITEGEKGRQVMTEVILSELQTARSKFTDQTIEMNENIKSGFKNVKIFIKNVHQKLNENIGDLETYITSRFDDVDSSISDLATSMQSSFLNLNQEMKNLKEWTTLVATYSQSFQTLQYYNHRFRKINKTPESIRAVEGKRLATALLRPEGIRKWLFDMHYLFVGRKGIVFDHKGLLIAIIKDRTNQACTETYKKDIENAWNQMRNQQIQLYLLWIRAADILQTSTGGIAQLLKTRLEEQEGTIKSQLCSLVIENSANMICNGLYLLPDQQLKVICQDGYYPSKDPTTTCRTSPQVKCLHCNCVAKNSVSKACDMSGKCKCNSPYFGDKCESRNCIASNWGNWATTCEHGYVNCNVVTRKPPLGQQSRSRHPAIHKEGNGKCENLTEERSCTSGCVCDNHIECDLDNQKVCANEDNAYREPRIFCTGKRQCHKGYSNDEHGCNRFRCHEHTSRNQHQGNSIDVLEKLSVSCGSDLLGGFKVLRDNFNRLQTRYRCCQIDSNFREMYAVNPSTTCNKEAFINGFQLKKTFGLEFQCFDTVSDARGAYYIFNARDFSHTKKIEDNDARALENVDISCPYHQFLSRFQWKITGKELKYDYKCLRYTYKEKGGGGRGMFPGYNRRIPY